MKKLITCLLLLIATSAFAGAKGQDWNNTSEIVPPSRATGASRYVIYTLSASGDILVCSGWAEYRWRDNTCSYNGKNQWKTLQQAVPSGKTYAGFKLTSGEYGRAAYEVYWK